MSEQDDSVCDPGYECCPQYRETIRELRAEVERLTRENAKLRHRLEVDREFVDDGSGQLVERPADLPESCDGISCRDATIKLQDEAIERLTRERDALRAREPELIAAACCVRAGIRMNKYNDKVCTQQERADEAESALAAERKRCGQLEGAGADLDALIVRAQEKLCAWLHPDSAHDERECMNELLEMFDGPRQREIQSVWRKATGVK